MRVAKWDRHTKEFKAGAVARMKDCANVQTLAAELKVSRQMLYRWRYELEGKPPQQRPKGTRPDTPVVSGLKQEIGALKMALADKTLEVDFFKGALRRFEDRRRRRSGGSESTTTSQK
jgi:transposase-like protein